MRFGIYDGIVETHVASSLARAMRAAGHEVYNTGKIGHGFKFASSKQELHKLGAHLDRLLEWEPDVIFVFRPASLPYNLLRRAKSTGAKLVVWLSDDPVLWDLTYGPVLDEYDLVLHCGTERVLRFYEEQFGRPTGSTFRSGPTRSPFRMSLAVNAGRRTPSSSATSTTLSVGAVISISDPCSRV